MKIGYREDLSTVAAEDLHGFFVGWPKAPSREQHLAVLRGSHRAVIAVDEESGRVVGFVNLISDGVLTAFVPWLEVLPEYQAYGIGSELMRRVLEGTEKFYSVDLLCDAPLQTYYERFGMQAVPGMTLHHRGALEG